MADNEYGKYIRRGVPNETATAGKEAIIPALLEGPQGWSGIHHKIDWKYITAPAVVMDEAHSHDFEEFIIIQGNNPADPKDFDAEIELSMGEEGEKHIITGTTIVAVPAGIVHGPLTFTRVGKPIVFTIIYMSPDYVKKPAVVNEQPAPTGETKYGKYILREPRGEDNMNNPKQVWGASLSDKVTAKAGVFNCNFNFLSILEGHMLSDPPHEHTFDEFLFLIPADHTKWPELGGEMEIGIGPNWERHTINTAAVICLPKGIQHCPVFMKNVDKPFYWGHVVPGSSYGSSEHTDDTA